MKMGIERVLKEKFGDAVKDICQVYDDQINETTVEVGLFYSLYGFLLHDFYFSCLYYFYAGSEWSS